jgi:hypothetical protein
MYFDISVLIRLVYLLGKLTLSLLLMPTTNLKMEAVCSSDPFVRIYHSKMRCHDQRHVIANWRHVSTDINQIEFSPNHLIHILKLNVYAVCAKSIQQPPLSRQHCTFRQCLIVPALCSMCRMFYSSFGLLQCTEILCKYLGLFSRQTLRYTVILNA